MSRNFIKNLSKFDHFFQKERIASLTWVIIPLLIIWISVNYIVGNLRKPVWDRNIAINTQNQINSPSLNSAQAFRNSNTQKIHWKNTGLVTIWFDDAWLDQYTNAFPILDEQNLPASLAVPTSLIGDDDYMSWPQIKRLYYKGWEITAHSRTHTCDIKKLTPTAFKSEIEGSKKDLESQGIQPQAYVTPCGVETPYAVQLIKNNYLMLRTSDDGLNPLPITSPYDITTKTITSETKPSDITDWLDQASKDHKWLILMFHQVDQHESKYDTTPNNFRLMIQEVKKSHLPVVLPTQVLEMVIDE